MRPFLPLLLTPLLATACSRSRSGDSHPNLAPTAQISASGVGCTDEAFTISAEGSSDPDGDPLEYQWVVTSPDPSFTLEDAGAASLQVVPRWMGHWSFVLTVSDGELDSEPVQLDVEICGDFDPDGLYLIVNMLDVAPDLLGLVDVDSPYEAWVALWTHADARIRPRDGALLVSGTSGPVRFVPDRDRPSVPGDGTLTTNPGLNDEPVPHGCPDRPSDWDVDPVTGDVLALCEGGGRDWVDSDGNVVFTVSGVMAIGYGNVLARDSGTGAWSIFGRDIISQVEVPVLASRTAVGIRALPDGGWLVLLHPPDPLESWQRTVVDIGPDGVVRSEQPLPQPPTLTDVYGSAAIRADGTTLERAQIPDTIEFHAVRRNPDGTVVELFDTALYELMSARTVTGP